MNQIARSDSECLCENRLLRTDHRVSATNERTRYIYRDEIIHMLVETRSFTMTELVCGDEIVHANRDSLQRREHLHQQDTFIESRSLILVIDKLALLLVIYYKRVDNW